MIVGIDPGVSGAIATMFPDGMLSSVVDMPTVRVQQNRQRVDAGALRDSLDHLRGFVDLAAVEDVGAFRGEAAGSSFTFGRACGVIEGVLAALRIPYVYVTPKTWQRHVGKPTGSGKEWSYTTARALWPSHADVFLKSKDGRADAALIASWARAQVAGGRAA